PAAVVVPAAPDLANGQDVTLEIARRSMPAVQYHAVVGVPVVKAAEVDEKEGDERSVHPWIPGANPPESQTWEISANQSRGTRVSVTFANKPSAAIAAVLCFFSAFVFAWALGLVWMVVSVEEHLSKVVVRVVVLLLLVCFMLAIGSIVRSALNPPRHRLVLQERSLVYELRTLFCCGFKTATTSISRSRVLSLEIESTVVTTVRGNSSTTAPVDCIEMRCLDGALLRLPSLDQAARHWVYTLLANWLAGQQEDGSVPPA
ncbi:unnamed protein product, partial [Phaeothamnion confervicola]